MHCRDHFGAVFTQTRTRCNEVRLEEMQPAKTEGILPLIDQDDVKYWICSLFFTSILTVDESLGFFFSVICVFLWLEERG